MSFFSINTFGKGLGDYHYLSEKVVTSDTYEIVKLIDGKINGVLFSEETQMLWVVSCGHMWKINTNGHIVDSLPRKWGWFYRSGILINDNTYVDWFYTGSKQKHKIPDLIDGNNMSDAAFRKYLKEAEMFEFFERFNDQEKKELVALLKIKDHWVAMDITSRRDEIYSEHRSDYGDGWWKTSFLSGEIDKRDGIQLVTGPVNKSGVDKKSQPLSLRHLDKGIRYYETGSFSTWLFYNALSKAKVFELVYGIQGERLSSHWYGAGYFQLDHNFEKLKFKAFVSHENNEFPNVSVSSFPNGAGESFKVIEIKNINPRSYYIEDEENSKLYKKIKFYEKETGLYVVRKKEVIPARRDVVFGQLKTYQLSDSWQPVITGVLSEDEVWGTANFYNDHAEPRYYLLNFVAEKNSFYQIPKKMTLNWRNKEKSFVIKLHLTNENFILLNQNSEDKTLSLEMTFDEAEIVGAFQRLAGDKQPMSLEVDFQVVDEFELRLVPRLANQKTSINLEHVSYKQIIPDYEANDASALIKFEKRKLGFEFTKALENPENLKNYLNISQQIAQNSLYAKEYALHFSAYTADLLNNRNKANDFKSAEWIFSHYINHIIPFSGLHEKSQYVASRALVLAVQTNDENVSDLVFEKILGVDYDVTTIEYNVLLFNLACYYSLRKEKSLMLKSIKQALKQGKKKEEFLADSDFENYWDDEDFLQMINSL